MGLFDNIKQSWDYTRLEDTTCPDSGCTIHRTAQHVIIFDPKTGEPIVDRMTDVFPSGISNYDTIENPALTTSARSLVPDQLLCRSIQIQAIRPNGDKNLGLVAIGDSSAQTFYLKPDDVWGDSAPLGQTMDLSQIYVRALTDGDCISLQLRA